MRELEIASVALDFEDKKLEEVALDLCALAGVAPSAQTSNGASLVLTDRRSRPEDPHRRADAQVVCGWHWNEECDLRLPSEGSELIKLIRGWSSQEKHPGSITLVAAWHGGGGSTACSFALARELKAALLDASGNLSFPVPEQIGQLSWGKIDPEDLPPGSTIVRELPRINDIPTLTSAFGSPRHPPDPEVMAVAVACPRPVVVDCGSDVVALARLRDRLSSVGRLASVVLVGRALDNHAHPAARALSALDADAGGEPILVLTVGRVSSLFRSMETRFTARWSQAPRAGSRRGWKRVVQDL